MFFDRRRYGGRMRLVNRCRSPSMTRLSLIRGAWMVSVPAPVDVAWLAAAVAYDLRVALFVAGVPVAVDVVVDLGLERGDEHAPGSFAHELVERRGGVEVDRLRVLFRVVVA